MTEQNTDLNREHLDENSNAANVKQTVITDPPAVRLENATKVYGRIGTEAAVVAIDSISLTVNKQQFVSIMGPSGSGKSTLLHCAAGLDSLTYGSAYIGDIEITKLGDADLTKVRRNNIGFIFQAFNLLPTLTAVQNIVLPIELASLKLDKEWFDQLIESLGIQDRLNHLPSELSGGQQQRVAAARAMITKPTVLFADEPTGNLDSKSGVQLLQFLKYSTRSLNQTVVIVTHDAKAAANADVVYLVKDGKLDATLEAPTLEQLSGF